MDNRNYDLVASLHKKLKAVTIYDKYIQDCSGDQECSTLWQQIRNDDLRHVDLLKDQLSRHVKDESFK
jgi:hypothetical protein